MIPNRYFDSADGRSDVVAVRASAVIPLAGETPARGPEALAAPLEYIDNAVIVARQGVIEAIEPYAKFARRAGLPKGLCLDDLGDVVLVPGLVNCHTHLEISHMAGKTVLGKGFNSWVASLAALDRDAPAATEEDLRTSVTAMAASGTALAGDISSRMPLTVLKTARILGLETRIFCEIIGHAPNAVSDAIATADTDPAFSLAGHALYTTSGEAMIRARAWCVQQGRPFSLHLAEHEDEARCLLEGAGKLHDLLRERILPASWKHPGLPPVRYAASLGLLAPGTLAVHCVQCDDADIGAIVTGGAAVCLCPRSNAAINVGEAPARALADKGALLTLGTDSLASNTDLDVWNEAEYFLKKNIFPAKALLRMTTVNGAAVLGFSHLLGRLEKGMRFWYRAFPREMITLLR